MFHPKRTPIALYDKWRHSVRDKLDSGGIKKTPKLPRL